MIPLFLGVLPFNDHNYYVNNSSKFLKFKNALLDNIRTACNKIIHANSIRPIYDHLGVEVGEDIWYLTGEIELEIHNQCTRLVANCIIFYNASILSCLYEYYGNTPKNKRINK